MDETDVVLRINKEKAELIKAQMIDGEKYILIPVGEDVQLKVNGEKMDI